MLSKGYNTSLVGFERELSVTAAAPDLDGLLAAWLEELLMLLGEGFVIGDLIVIEVGQDSKSYGASGMSVRGAARGRMLGTWFQPEGGQVVGVKYAVIERRRRTLGASVLLKW